MYLHQHPRAQLIPFEGVCYVEHRNLDDVAGRTLDWHVDRFAFSRSANVGVAIVDPRQRTNAAIDRTDVTVLAGFDRHLVHVTAHTFVSVVVILNYFLRGLARDADPL